MPLLVFQFWLYLDCGSIPGMRKLAVNFALSRIEDFLSFFYHIQHYTQIPLIARPQTG